MTMRAKPSVAPANRAGLITRFAHSTAGNAIMLVAAGLVPLTAMIGSGVDMARVYMVKSRLQQACDAGALAGRKYMTGTTLDATAAGHASAFFRNNFPASPPPAPAGTFAFGTTNVTFTPVRNAAGHVTGTANARVPMAVMKIMGYTHIDLAVTCEAKYEVGNVDVAMVLDVTNSMTATLPSGRTRIAELKLATIKFFETLGPGDDTTGRIRYAVLPYGRNVNVGYSLPSSYLVGGGGTENWIYQTRVARMDTPEYLGTPGTPVITDNIQYGGSISQSDCAKYGRNQSFSGFSPSSTTSGGPPPAATTATSFSNNSTTGVDWSWSGAPDTSGTSRSCRRKKTDVTTTYTLVGYKFTNWIYKQTNINVGDFATGSPVTLLTTSTPTGYVPNSGEYDIREILTAPGSTVAGTTSSVTWGGCIEERDSIETITSTTPIGTVPTGALDLDIDLLPTDTDSKWKPSWINVVYSRSTLADTTSGTKETEHGCPTDRARRLMTYSSIDASPTGHGSLSSFRNYVNGLTLTNGTLHDIGLAWGLRFISGGGIFSADNPNTWNGQPVQRHVVFMTDGFMNSQTSRYIFNGYNELDQRMAPRGTSDATLVDVHNRRLRILCEQARQRNITLWMVALGEGTAADYPDMLACAASADHFLFVDDDLEAAFQQIATKISKLRLSQ